MKDSFQKNTEKDWQIQRLNKIISHYDEQLKDVKNSTSWKITTPIRTLKTAIRKGNKAIYFTYSKIINKLISFPLAISFLKKKNDYQTPSNSLSYPEYALSKSPSVIEKRDYHSWLAKYYFIDDTTRSDLLKKVNLLEKKPLISILLPTYNPDLQWLTEAIESVKKQLYSNWELCIVDDASNDDSVKIFLRSFEQSDARIKINYREKNGHISKASNDALSLSTGEWIALLDQDDVLSPDALFWIAQYINDNPNAKLLYSDEDKIDESGTRSNPYFKCDWNVDLFYSHNLITHIGVYCSSILRKIGGFREGFEGAQDYDIALRFIEQIDHEQIIHIPRVLYSWRVHRNSTASSPDAKPYAMLAGEKAINEHLKRSDINATVQLLERSYRIYYSLPPSPPVVSIIIPTKNSKELLENCISSILGKTQYPHYEIIIVDNGSEDFETLQYLSKLYHIDNIRILFDDSPFNYSAINNKAVRQSHGDVICLLNNDIEVISPDWLDQMVSFAIQPEVGAVGAKLYYPDKRLQHCGIILGLGVIADHAHKNQPYESNGYYDRAHLIQSFSAVTGACLTIKKAIYEKLDGLNEKNLAISLNDIDFCLRLIDAGYRNIWTPFAELYHHESATRGYEDTPEKKARFEKELNYMKKKWGKKLLNDPSYNPNLSLGNKDFQLAWPPRTEYYSQ